MTIVLGSGSILCFDNSNTINGSIMTGFFSDSSLDNIEINNYTIDGLNLSGKSVTNLNIQNSKLKNINFNNTTFFNLTFMNNIICNSSINDSQFNSGIIRDICLVNTTSNRLYFTQNFDILKIEYVDVKPTFKSDSKIINLVNKNPIKCFHKNTIISLKTKNKRIKNIKPGDILDKNQIVKTVSKHKVKRYINMIKIPKYSLDKKRPINELLVSPLHYILYEGEYIHAYQCVGKSGITLVNTYIDYLFNITLENEYQSFLANNTFNISDRQNGKLVDCYINSSP